MAASPPKEDGDKAEEDETNKKNDAPMASVGETMSFVFGCGFKVKCLFALGCAAGIGNGCVYPALAYIFSNSFSTISASADGLSGIRDLAFTFMIVGAAALVAACLQTGCLEVVAHQATRSFRLQWFKSLLRQDTAFFDIYDVAGIAQTIGPNSNKVRRGLGRKFGEGLQFGTTFVGGIAYAFYSSWQVALVVIAALPFMSLSALYVMKLNQTKGATASQAYSRAGSVAYSTVSAIKTVLSLNAIPEMIRQYSEATLQAYKQSTGLLWKLGFANGSMLGSFILLYCLLTLFGTFLIYRDLESTGCDPSNSVPDNDACPQDGAAVFGAMLGVAFAAQGLSQCGNFFSTFTEARVACYTALQAINRKAEAPEEMIYAESSSDKKDKKDATDIEEASSNRELRAILPKYSIDSSASAGLKPKVIKGEISFKGVSFYYPTRPDDPILKDFCLEIPEGKTVALVGPSGGGKSTTVALIERFYDPQSGTVSLDGNDIRDINVHYLRSQIGYVGQEPSLFATTIRGNIKYGKPDATQEEVESAAREANAHDFIMAFPDGYDTQVGDKGAQLSGGQKQRIAIARVLVANPRILLLDEATSALDSESELIVQEALDNVLAEHRRTTIVIAHRLSTVRNADVIAVIAGGRVVETGTHDELIAREGGNYQKLVESQERGLGSRANSRQPSTHGSFSSFGGDSFSSRGSSANLTELVEMALRLEGKIELLEDSLHFNFKDVSFAYPTRANRKVLDGFNLSIRRGETVALVGPSGGGKSTTVSLIERFYDVDEGSIEYCGVDIRQLNLEWYRDQIGYVGQEPILFSATIAENIKYGYAEATFKEIEHAAVQANAHDFIMSLPKGYETEIGDRGTQLSGGQKQRVAIARALVRKPHVIILDEATSALDNESEAVVQEALDKIMESNDHTTIVIAHRLSTIRGVDRIAFIADGEVKEFGSHDELIRMHHGRYRRLVEAQTKRRSTAHLYGGTSRVSTIDEGEEEEPDFEAEIEEDAQKSFSAKRAREMARPDAAFMLLGSIGALIAGGVFPAWGIMFGETINLLFKRVPECIGETADGVPCDVFFEEEADSMRRSSFEISVYWAIIAFGCVAGNMLTFYGFGQASERLNKRVRDSAFSALVRQEVAFFDRRSVGSITSSLEEDAARIHTFSGEPVRSLLIALSSVITGLVISFVFMWPFALLSVACIPLMGASTSLEMKRFLGEDEGGSNGQDELNSPGGIAVETLLNIRTVAALTLENERYRNYENALQHEQPNYVQDSFVDGLTSGLSMFVQQWVNALQFWWGGWLLFNYPGSFTVDDFLISMFALLFSLFGLGAAFQGISDKKEMEKSAGRIFYLLDRESEIDPLSDEGKKLD